MLTLENTVFVQGDFTLAADVTIGAGQVTAVIGPSGAGKSTLLHGIAGFVDVQSGAIIWDGQAVHKLPPAKRPVSMLFQDNNLFPHLTVLQNVALALAPRLRPSAGDVDQAEDMLAQVGLGGLSDRKPNALSGGQQSRVALARALLQDRPVMLLDEPFSALGPGLKSEMLELSVSLAKGRTIVMVSHDPQDAAQIADDVIGILPGQVFAPQTAKAFLANPPAPFHDYFGTP